MEKKQSSTSSYDHQMKKTKKNQKTKEKNHFPNK